MSKPDRADFEALMDAMSAALDLELETDWRPGVAQNLAVLFDNARLVEGLALPDESDPAPIYKA
jgi:hypothetical protein